MRVLAAAAGVRQIEARGERKGLLGRLFRLVDGPGEEHEHTARPVAADRGRPLRRDRRGPRRRAANARARDVLAAHGGHFVSYYSRWSTEDLVP